jgi:Flagellar protein FliT
MSPGQRLSHYESLAQLMLKMRSTAELGEWDALVDFEAEYNLLAGLIKEPGTQADMGTKQRVIELSRQILADQSLIRSFTEQRMDYLQNSMQSNRQEQRLNQAYGAT